MNLLTLLLSPPAGRRLGLSQTYLEKFFCQILVSLNYIWDADILILGVCVCVTTDVQMRDWRLSDNSMTCTDLWIHEMWKDGLRRHDFLW